MPWNNPGGPSPWGNPRPGGPWGSPPQPPGGGGSGGSRGPGPDLDEFIRQAQEAVRRFLPRGGGGKGIALLVLLLVFFWGISGFYRVQTDELGIVMRFGAYNRQAAPGLNYHIPWPVESVTTPQVTRINRVDIGFRAPADTPLQRQQAQRDIVEESLMLTGDENIIDIDFAVFWRIRNAAEFLFNTRNPEGTIKSAAESVMREVIGRTPIQPALTEARAQIENQVRDGAQAIMDSYGAGVEITQVQMLNSQPPPRVIDAFIDVQRAGADRERARNEAETYRNDIIPRAHGEAQRLVQEAQGYRDSQVARARGEAQRFLSVLTAYQAAQDITTRRMYLETMEEILRRNPKIVVDSRLQGIVPFLQLGGEANAPRPGGAVPAGAAAATLTRPPPAPSSSAQPGGFARPSGGAPR